MKRYNREDDIQRVYEFVKTFIETQGRQPSQREIAEATYIGRSSVVRFLDILVARGLLERTENVARGISLPRKRQE